MYDITYRAEDIVFDYRLLYRQNNFPVYFDRLRRAERGPLGELRSVKAIELGTYLLEFEGVQMARKISSKRSIFAYQVRSIVLVLIQKRPAVCRG